MPWWTGRRILCVTFVILLALLVFNSALFAQDELLQDSGGAPKTYMIELSGKVLNEDFSGARASVEIALPSPDSLNAYLIVIRGFPKLNSRNTIYWHSDGSDMTVTGGEISCDIKRTFLRPVKGAFRCHFFYISPILLKPIKGMFLSPKEKERKQGAEKRALPTLVYAQAGQLKIRVYSDMVSGSVWMKGYDLIEHSYVEYNASFSGETATRLKPKWQRQEPQRDPGDLDFKSRSKFK